MKNGNAWRSKDVLITGGLGFIGSNLAHALTDEGANVTILDAGLPEYGANAENIRSIQDEVRLIEGDIRDSDALSRCSDGIDIIYHCAAQLSRPISLEEPIRDVEINCAGLINVLEAAATQSNTPKVVFLSSQAVVGKPQIIPVDEETRAQPVDIYGANKRVGEHYCRIYHQVKDVPTVVVRLSNVYGPRAQLSNPNYGVINRFISLALRGKSLEVFEPGTMLRDFVFVDDVVRAIRLVGRSDESDGERYMVASGTTTSIKKLAEIIASETGRGEVEIAPWPEDWDRIRIGDVRCDASKITDDLGWKPEMSIRPGIRETISYYQTHSEHYL